MAVQYFQNDSRWEKKPLGFNPNATIRDFGCLLTSMTMVANHFGGDYTPESYNEVMKQNDGYSPGQQWIKTFAITKVLPSVKYQKGVECPNTPAPMADIDAGLAAGSLVIVNVDRDAKDTTFSPADGHWVVIHKKQGSDYLIWDPFQSAGAAETLIGRYGFGFKNASQIIKQAIWFGTNDFPAQPSAPTAPAKPAPPSTPTQPASTSTPSQPASNVQAVQPTVDQLALRREPVSNPANIVKLLAKNAVLRVLAGGEKLGQQNQWLKVRDAAGDEGHVAAWYVKATTASAPTAPATPPTTTTGQLTVTTTGDQVSFRTQPLVAENTLIRYLTKGTKLTVTEGGNASTKIGVQNQWLKVRASDNKEGYVAAWFVV